MTQSSSIPKAGEEAAPEAYSRSFLLRSKTLSGVMVALKANEGTARRQEVHQWAAANLSFTAWEQEERGKSSVHCWWKFMNDVTTDAFDAGGTFIAPKASRWSELVVRAQADHNWQSASTRLPTKVNLHAA